MPIVQLRPNHTYRQAGWTATGGTVHAVLADDSDATYVERTANTGVLDVRVAAGALLVPEGARVTAVRTGLRLRRSQAGQEVRQELRYDANQLDGGGGRVLPVLDLVAPASPAWAWGPWWDVRAFSHPDLPGHDWNGAALDVLALWMTAATTTGHRLYAAAVEVDYASAPTVELIAPPAVVDDTTRPPVELAYSDPDDPSGDSQTAWEVRLYEGSVPPSAVAPPGFAGSGHTAGSGNIWTPPDLEVGQPYTALARVAKATPGSGDLFSTWAATEFVIDLATPAPPTLVVTPEPDQGRHHLALSDPGGDVAAEWYGVEYRDGDDQPWRWVRGASHLPANGTVVHYDYEAPFAAERTYRTRARAILSGQEVASGPTVLGATLVVPSSTAWLVDVRDPARLNGRVYPTDDRQRTWVGREVAHQPADLEVSVVESEVPTRRDQVTLLAPTPEAHQLLVEAMASTRTLLYRDDRREHFYFRWVGDRQRRQIGDREFDADAFTATQVEVARPAT